MRINQRKGQSRREVLQTGDQRAAAQVRLSQIAGNPNEPKPLYSGLNVGIRIVDDQRLFHAKGIIPLSKRKMPLDTPTGTVVQVANGAMLFQLVKSFRLTVMKEII